MVLGSATHLSAYGEVVAECWDDIPYHFKEVRTDAFVIMPNHVHGIIIITDGGRRSSRSSLASVVAFFKYQSTKRINATLGVAGSRVWQRNYSEHVVRDDPTLNRIRQYIMNNPLHWDEDEENPNRRWVPRQG